jgi:hypothetical protein
MKPSKDLRILRKDIMTILDLRRYDDRRKEITNRINKIKKSLRFTAP